jgi:hypothetical protein
LASWRRSASARPELAQAWNASACAAGATAGTARQRRRGRFAARARRQNGSGSLQLPPEGNRGRVRNTARCRLSAQMLRAQFIAYTPSSSVGPAQPPEPATVLKVLLAATYSCTLATWITLRSSTKL